LAGPISLGVSLIVAILLFAMPVGQALLAATEGAAFGFFAIMLLVLMCVIVGLQATPVIGWMVP
jgi:lactate permease